MVKRIAGPVTGKKNQTEESMGFPKLEELLEKDEADLAGMKKSHEELVKLSKKATSAKQKGQARIAATAYDRFFRLFDELLKIKSDLLKEAKNTSKSR